MPGLHITDHQMRLIVLDELPQVPDEFGPVGVFKVRASILNSSDLWKLGSDIKIGSFHTPIEELSLVIGDPLDRIGRERFYLVGDRSLYGPPQSCRCVECHR